MRTATCDPMKDPHGTLLIGPSILSERGPEVASTEKSRHNMLLASASRHIKPHSKTVSNTKDIRYNHILSGIKSHNPK